jgi:hypothetical protein
MPFTTLFIAVSTYRYWALADFFDNLHARLATERRLSCSGIGH